MALEPAPLRRLVSTTVALPAEVTVDGTARKVLEAGLTLFAERGFFGASIRDIATAAGVQPATLYDHYASKEHLLAELVRIGHEEHHRMLRAALLDAGAEPDQQLSAVVRAHVQANAGLASLAVVANSELHVLSPEMAAPALALRRSSEHILLEVIERGVRLDVFDVDDPWLAAAAIGAMGIRVANWLDGSDDRYSAAEVADRYAVFALRMVGHKQGGSA